MMVFYIIKDFCSYLCAVGVKGMGTQTGVFEVTRNKNATITKRYRLFKKSF